MDDMEDTSVDVASDPHFIRRTLTVRNNAARQVAVNFMPSRQQNTVRHRRKSEHNVLLDEVDESVPLETEDQKADIIVKEMELHQVLMEDNPEAEALRKEALRDLPQGLTMKRHVRAKLSASVSLRSKNKPISMSKRVKYRIGFAWKRSVLNVRGVTSSVRLWYEAIRNVEGHFGSAVGSFFYFLSFLFQMNLVILIFVLGFIVTPQVLHDDITTDRLQTRSLGFLDFISGKGILEDSLLFYGHYHSGDISTPTPLQYNMPFAYFFTMSCLFIVFFAVLCYRTLYSYRRNFISPGRGLSLVFAGRVFCGWDFSIATTEAAELNCSSIYNEFKEILSEYNNKPSPRTRCVRIGQWTANVIVSVVILGLIGLLGYGLWRLLALETHREAIVSGALTATLTVCPVVAELIARLEYYSPRTKLYLTLGRTWIIDIGTLVLILYYWAKSGVACWEDRFGEEMYRLVLLDCVISLFLLPIIEFVRGWLFKLDKTSVPPEFNIAYNSLTVIYNQALLWFGMLFSPLLVVAVTLKFLILFYVKKESAFRACQPARKIWRAAQTQTVLYTLVTLAMFTALLSIGSLFLNEPSVSCGPFRSYDTVVSVLTEGVLHLSHHQTLHSSLLFLTKPGVIAFVILFLCVGVYYVRAKAQAQHSMVEILRLMLLLQAKDKEFLLTAIAKVSNGEWLYSPKLDDSTSPDSHTWKYLKEVRKPSNAGYNFDASRLNHSMLERPKSYAMENRPSSSYIEKPKSNEDGDTDSSFSWQGSSSYLNQKDPERGKKLM